MKSPLRSGLTRFDLERVQAPSEQAHAMAEVSQRVARRRQTGATIEASAPPKLHDLICQLISAVKESYVTGRPIAKAESDAIYRLINHNRAMLRSGNGKSKKREN
jgi:hypothetical protein